MSRSKKQYNNDADFRSFIEDKLQELSIEVGDEIGSKKLDVIKTGSLSLDISTGVGGIPRGKITEIYGSEATGKTTLALSVANQAILANIDVLYIDAENTLDDDYASAIVDDLSRLMILRPSMMEHALVVAEEGIKNGRFGLIILDSIGGLAPKKVLDDELTDANVALLSRLLTVWVQRNGYLIKKNNVAFVGLNQVRDKIGSYMGGYETPGGHTWKHACSLRIMLGKSDDIEMSGEKVGILSRFVVKKNKLAPPFRAFTFPIFFGSGIDSTRDVIEFSVMLGIIVKKGPHFTFEDTTLGQGMVNSIEYLNNNKDVLDKIVNMCYSSIQMKTKESEIEDEENIS